MTRGSFSWQWGAFGGVKTKTVEHVCEDRKIVLCFNCTSMTVDMAAAALAPKPTSDDLWRPQETGASSE